MVAVVLYTGGAIGIGPLVGWIGTGIAIGLLWKARAFTRQLTGMVLLSLLLLGAGATVLADGEDDPDFILASKCKDYSMSDWEFWALGCFGLPR